jgi:hypothetical protein
MNNGQGTEIASRDEFNPYLDFGREASRTRIVGKILKFNKRGDWTYGENATEMPDGTRLIAHMGELLEGWIKWEDHKPTEQIMSYVRDRGTPRYKVPTRSELGDTEREDWPVDNNGIKRDPWQFCNYLIMMDQDGNLYTFTPSSKGGKQALATLSMAFGHHMRVNPNEYPVVTLGGDQYPHPNKQFGMIDFPIFSIVSWCDKAVIDKALQDNAAGQDYDREVDDLPPKTELPKNDYKAQPAQAAQGKMEPQKNGMARPRF